MILNLFEVLPLVHFHYIWVLLNLITYGERKKAVLRIIGGNFFVFLPYSILRCFSLWKAYYKLAYIFARMKSILLHCFVNSIGKTGKDYERKKNKRNIQKSILCWFHLLLLSCSLHFAVFLNFMKILHFNLAIISVK